MSEPFYDFIANNRLTVSNRLYGYEDKEKRYRRIPYRTLPKVPELNTPLWEALLRRKSTRKFSETSMPLSDLSALLFHSLARKEDSLGAKKYPFPSGGAFYPIESYLLVHNVEGLESGVYHYATVDHAVARVGDAPKRTLRELNLDYGCFFESIPPVILHMTLVKSRCVMKYGSLIYLAYQTEAGHRGQNLYLVASALRLGVCAMAAGNYEKTNQMLGVDGMNEHHIYGMAIGRASS